MVKLWIQENTAFPYTVEVLQVPQELSQPILLVELVNSLMKEYQTSVSSPEVLILYCRKKKW